MFYSIKSKFYFLAVATFLSIVITAVTGALMTANLAELEKECS